MLPICDTLPVTRRFTAGERFPAQTLLMRAHGRRRLAPASGRARQASGNWARSSACSCSLSSSSPSGCAARCCSPRAYRSSARCSPSSCPSHRPQPGRNIRRSRHHQCSRAGHPQRRGASPYRVTTRPAATARTAARLPRSAQPGLLTNDSGSRQSEMPLSQQGLGQGAGGQGGDVGAALRGAQLGELVGERQSEQEREQDLHAGLRDPQFLEQVGEVAVGRWGVSPRSPAFQMSSHREDNVRWARRQIWPPLSP